MTRKGQRHSPESREKMRLAHLGKPSNRKGAKISQEQIDAMKRGRIGKSGPMKGKKQTTEARQKMSLAKRGKVGPRLGQSPSQETREKIRQKLIGKCYNIFTEGHREKISEANKGRPSPMLGRHHSEESKMKSRLSQPTFRGGPIPLASRQVEISKRIRKRDGFSCMLHDDFCVRKLNVHHIIPRAICQSYLLPYEDEDSNLITLCTRHHKTVEWYPAEYIPQLRLLLSERYGYIIPDDTHFLMPALLDNISRLNDSIHSP